MIHSATSLQHWVNRNHVSMCQISETTRRQDGLYVWPIRTKLKLKSHMHASLNKLTNGTLILPELMEIRNSAVNQVTAIVAY